MRFTEKKGDSYYAHSIIADENGFSGEAIDKLAGFETMCCDLQQSLVTISAQLETLRAAGKEKTVKFRELLGQKMTESYMLTIIKGRGLL